MSADLPTLAVIETFAGFLQAIALIAQVRVNTSRKGLGWWTAGNATLAVGFTFTSLRDTPPWGPFAIVLRTLFIAAGMALLYVGVLRFLGRRERPWPIVAVCALFAVVVAVSCVLGDVRATGMLASAVLAGFSLLIVRALSVHKSPALTASARFLATVFAINGSFFLLQLLATVFAGSADGVLGSASLQVASYFVSVGASTLWTFGFIIMVNQRLNAQSQDAKEQLELVFNNSPDAALLTRMTDGVISAVSDGFTELSGFGRSEAVGCSTLELGLWREPAERRRVVEEVAERGHCENFEVTFVRKNGTPLLGMMSARSFALDGVLHILSVTRDVTARKGVEDALRQSQAFLSEVIENNGAVISVKDREGRYELVNKQWEKTTGLGRAAVIGNTDGMLFSAETARGFGEADAKVMELGEMQQFEESLEDASGKRFFLSIKFPLRDTHGEIRGTCGISTDITDRKHYEVQIKDLASQLEVERDHARIIAKFDALTTLANRGTFDESLATEFARAKRTGAPLSLIMIDVDHFKKFNDSCGHLAGDDCLRQVGEAVKDAVRRPGDTAARYGGEEFALILPETHRRGALAVAERLRLAIAELDIPHPSSPNAQYVTVSLGIATTGSLDLVRPESLVALADKALYRAKDNGRNRTEMGDVAPVKSGSSPPDPQSGVVRLVWRSAYECGNPAIDAEHKSLFSGVNKILSAIMSGRPKEQCQALLQSLLRTLAEHFCNEEAVLMAAGYSQTTAHANRHAELLARATELADSFANGRVSSGELFGFLADDLVVKHILAEDQAYFKHLG